MITGAVEQYIRRTEAGRNLLKSLIGNDTEAYISQFDVVFNEASGKTCCVFTESNLIAWKSALGWQYQKGSEVGLNSPYGLANTGQTCLIAVNDFNQGVLIIDSRDMSIAKFFDVPIRGVKHLSYASG
jgi:hypothetical protein